MMIDDTPASSQPLVSAITDSPWFWVLLFSCVGLVAMELIDRKFSSRQAQLEKQYQGRQFARLEQGRGEGNSSPTVEFSQPKRLEVTLWPIKLVALLAMGLSTVLLSRRQLLRVRNSAAAGAAS